MTGLTTLLNRFEENSVRKTAQAKPKGTPRISAPAVTITEPVIIGSKPKLFSVGYQSRPKRNFLKPYLNMIGVPSEKMKMVIMARIETAEKAIIRSANRVSFSFRCRRFIFASPGSILLF